MPDYKKEPMFSRPTFPGFVPEGQEHKYPAMGSGDKLRGFVPDGDLGTEMDEKAKNPDAPVKGKKKV